MKRALADLTAIHLLGYTPRPPRPLPFTTPIICCDAAKTNDHYQVGLFSPQFGIRILCCPPNIATQQQAELFACDASTRLAARLGWQHLTLISDNTGALLSLSHMTPSTSNATYCTIVRRCFNRLLWTGMHVTLCWVPSPLQPADHPSRHSIHHLHLEPSMRTSTWHTWEALLSCLSTVRFIGTLSL